MNLHTPSTAKLLAVISIATLSSLLLLWVALMPSAYAGQATDPLSLFATQPPGKSLPAPAVSPTAVFTTYLPLAVRSTAGAGTPTPTATPTQTTTPGPPPVQEGLFLTRTNKTDSASIAVDAAGGFHFAYAAYVHDASGHRPAYYAYCAPAVDCGIESSWVTVSLSDDAEDVQLALTKAGHPRLLLRGTEPTAPFDTLFQYAACDANCTDIANWTGVDLTTSQYSLVLLEDYPRHYFALDTQDRPRFLYRKTIDDGYYAYCDTNCSTTGTWNQYLVDPVIFSDPTNFPNLTFSSTDQPRISAMISTGSPNFQRFLMYIMCDSSCDLFASWTGVPLLEAGSGHTSSVLRFNSSGQPRMIFNQGTISGTAGYLWYLWCNSGCNDRNNWDASVTGMGAGLAEDPDLALDALNRPRIAFRILSPGGLFFGFCNANCESQSPDWRGDISERDTLLDSEWVILPWDGCSPTASYWYGGKRPSLALDTAGNPRIGYVAEHLVRAVASGCAVYEDMRAVRFVFFPKP